jgi:hypothetical protein
MKHSKPTIKELHTCSNVFLVNHMYREVIKEHLILSSRCGFFRFQICNKWRLNADGSERVERSGEEWDGKGWYQKGGETLINGAKVPERN